MSGPNWLEKVINNEVDGHWDQACAIVENIRAEYPGENSPDLLANEVIERKARLAAFIGLGTGTLQAIPAVGQALAIGSLMPEALYLAKMQVDIALVVALLYRQKLTHSEAKGIITTCLVLGLGAEFVKNELRIETVKITTKIIEAAIERLGEKAIIDLLERIGIQATKKGILKRVPIIAIPVNAAMNYGQIETFGWAAKKFLSPSFSMCGSCGCQTGHLNKFCPDCGTSMG
jgi:hypothetical protein